MKPLLSVCVLFLFAGTWLPPLGGRLREAIHRFTTATAFRLKPEATHVQAARTVVD